MGPQVAWAGYRLELVILILWGVIWIFEGWLLYRSTLLHKPTNNTLVGIAFGANIVAVILILFAIVSYLF